MDYIDFTNIEAYQPLLDFQLKGENIDLHNDFDCVSAYHDTSSKSLVVQFRRAFETSVLDSVIRQCKIIFINVQDWKSNSPLEDIKKAITVDNFAKGEIMRNNKFHDDESLVKYYLIEFFEGQSIEIYCSGCIAILY